VKVCVRDEVFAINDFRSGAINVVDHASCDVHRVALRAIDRSMAEARTIDAHVRSIDPDVRSVNAAV
jgi:hypothetical protein